MIETEAQTLVVKALQAGGGQAMKMQNEFVRGVSDLLIKLPSKPAFFLEAKRNVFAASISPNHTFELDVSQLQKKFMLDWDRSGMQTGVLSFILERGGNITSLRMKAYTLAKVRGNPAGWFGMVGHHVSLGKSDVRYENIYNHLVEFAKDF